VWALGGVAIDTASIRRTLFIRTDRLGETLLNLPAIAALKAALPGASLTVLVHPELRPLLGGVPVIDDVMGYEQIAEPRWWVRAIRLGRALRPFHFDLAIVSNPKKELHAAVWLAGIQWRVGYDRKWGWLLTQRLPDRKALGERHEVEYNLDLVQALGLPATIPPWQYPQLVSEQSHVRELLEQQGIKPSDPFIAVHPWTSHPYKRWPAERFQALIRQSVDRLGIRVVVVGGPEERPHGQAVVPTDLPVVNLTGSLTLRQLAALLQRSRLLVSNDSGPVHLAAAVGTSTITLFGTPDAATGPRRWGPWGAGHTVIWKASMEAITVEEVFEALRKVLERSK